jgi:hypothetical protein
VDDTPRALPGNLRIAIRLRSRISEDMAVGTLIEGEVASNVRRAEGEAPIPAGSPVRGRIRRLERHQDPSPYFAVALEFTAIEIEGVRHRFHADAVEIQRAHGVERTLSFPGKPDVLSAVGRDLPSAEVLNTMQDANPRPAVTVSRTFVSAPDLPGVAAFFVKGGKLDVPSGLRTVWKTRAAGQ